MARWAFGWCLLFGGCEHPCTSVCMDTCFRGSWADPWGGIAGSSPSSVWTPVTEKVPSTCTAPGGAPVSPVGVR